MSRTDTRAALLRERRQCADALAATLLSGDGDNEKHQVLKARIEALNIALAAFPASSHAEYWRVAIVGLITALAVTVLLIKKANFVPVVLDIHSRTLTAKIDTAGSLPSLLLDGSVHIRGSDWVVTPPSMDSESAPTNEATVRAGWLRLENLDFPAGSTLEFRRNPESVSLLLTGAPAALQVQANGKTEVELGSPPGSKVFSGQLAYPETLRLGTDKHEGVGSGDRRLEVVGNHGAAETALIPLAPSQLKFLERAASTPGDVPRDESSIIRGTISFKGVKSSFNLSDGDVLVLEDLSDARGAMTIGSDIHLKMSTTARVVALSNEGTRRSLAPSLLEYFAENHGIELAWSSLVFIAGLVWTTSKFMFR